MALIPASRAVGAVAADSAAPKIAAGAFDAAVAYLARAATDAAGGYLQAAFASYVRPAGASLPVNLVTGSLAANGPLAGPSLVTDDSDFGHDSLQFTTTSATMTVDSGTPAQSWTFACVFTPHSSGATGILTQAYNNPSFGPVISLGSTGISIAAQYGTTAATVANRASLSETGPNILVVSGDAATRKAAVYLNSYSGSLTGVIAPDPWPTLASGYWGIGLFSGSSGQANCRVASAAWCNKALHTAADGPRRIAGLIAGAARQYGITLV